MIAWVYTLKEVWLGGWSGELGLRPAPDPGPDPGPILVADQQNRHHSWHSWEIDMSTAAAAAPLGAVGENRKPLESVMSVNMDLRYLVLAAEFFIKDFNFHTTEDDTKKIEKLLL